jgi:hypothetical protein
MIIQIILLHSFELIINSRFQKHTPGLEVPFSFYLQSIPCEWLTANASSEVHFQHDSQFPQSLVAAMNCLVHCKFTFFFFFCNPILFAICTSTSSKLHKNLYNGM